VDGVVQCGDCGAALVDKEPEWSDDPAAIHSIDREFKAGPIRDRFGRRRRRSVGESWRLAGPLHPRQSLLAQSAGRYLLQGVRTLWYLAVGVPANRLSKSRRLRKGPWKRPPL
jgi:hypothetical protein